MAGGDWRAWPVARAQERLDSEAGWPRIPPGGGAWVVGQEALPSSSYPANPLREDINKDVCCSRDDGSCWSFLVSS